MDKKTGGFLPLDPMDRPMVWFEYMGEMMIQLELDFAGPVDPGRLATAALLTLDSEPVLGCRLSHHWFKPFWQRIEVNTDDVFVSVSSRTEYDAFKHAALDSHAGPQMRVCLWNDATGAHLLIKVAHHAADAAGVRDVARIMSHIYGRLSEDPTFKPEPNLTRQENTVRLLEAVPKKEHRALKRQYHRYMKDLQKEKPTFRPPFDNGGAESPFFTRHTIPRDRVDALVRYGRLYDATLNDLLVSAFFRSQVKTGDWDGQSNLRITTTMDMRRYLAEKKASAVSNLSLSLSSWPSLGKDLGDDFLDTLKKVTAATRGLKENHPGFDAFVYVWPMIRFVPHGLAMKFVRGQMKRAYQQGNWADTLTNMGAINPAEVFFDGKPTSAVLLPPPLFPPYFMMGASGYDGTLTLSVGGYAAQKALSGRLVDTMAAELSI